MDLSLKLSQIGIPTVGARPQTVIPGKYVVLPAGETYEIGIATPDDWRKSSQPPRIERSMVRQPPPWDPKDRPRSALDGARLCLSVAGLYVVSLRLGPWEALVKVVALHPESYKLSWAGFGVIGSNPVIDGTGPVEVLRAIINSGKVTDAAIIKTIEAARPCLCGHVPGRPNVAQEVLPPHCGFVAELFGGTMINSKAYGA